MDWSSLKLLLKAPKKKYIKKLLQYAVALAPCRKSVPQYAITPVGQQFPQDLQLTSEQAHKLINTLIDLVEWSRESGLSQEELAKAIEPQIGEELAAIIGDLLGKLQAGIQIQAHQRVGQASRLLSFDWQLDMEVASDKGKTNTPVVELELASIQNCRVETDRLKLRGPQFEVFFKNLQKIKNQLSQLVTPEQ